MNEVSDIIVRPLTSRIGAEICGVDLSENLPQETIGEIPSARMNVNGGSIALGHPVGASGARLVLTLIKELNRCDLNTGLASLCIGGGQGGAIWVEKC